MQESISAFKSKAQRKNIKIECRVDPKTAELRLSAPDLRQILRILLDNAVKYGKNDISIHYSDYVFQVKNDGTTIPKDKIAYVFRRFYQVDKSAEGSGLGLAIAKALADRNNWELVATSDKNITTFSLEVK